MSDFCELIPQAAKRSRRLVEQIMRLEVNTLETTFSMAQMTVALVMAGSVLGGQQGMIIASLLLWS